MSLISQLMKAADQKGSSKAGTKGDSEDIGAALRRELKEALSGDDDAALDEALKAAIRHYSSKD